MLPEPSLKHVTRQIKAFEDDPKYHGADSTVEMVFRQWPRNSVFEEVLAKVVVLNRLYSTNIYDVYRVAQHILDSRIDARLANGDVALVEVLAQVKLKNQQRNFLSFASKYCSWHSPEHFQIFDGYVEWLIWKYREQFRFSEFRRYELRIYQRFISIIDDLRAHFGLTTLSRKALDKFLWIEGIQQWSALAGPAKMAPEG